MAAATTTGDRIVEVALDAFGSRGYEATSLDAIAAEAGVRKQTLLYWFPSKEALLAAVGERVAASLVHALDDGLRRADPAADRLEVVMRVVFRFAVRRPALLGFLREVERLRPEQADALLAGVAPLVERAVTFLGAEMGAGRLRPADARLTLLFTYAAVLGAATDLQTQRALGIRPGVSGLRSLRRELFAFLRAALRP
jgi:TetR/AcrR family transcriptional regulator